MFVIVMAGGVEFELIQGPDGLFMLPWLTGTRLSAPKP